MRILVNSFGTGGDEEPFVHLGHSLAMAGHEVTMLMNPRAVGRIEERGQGSLHLHPVGEPFDISDLDDPERYLHPLNGARLIWEHMYVPHIRAAFEGAKSLIDRDAPDVVLAHPFCLGSAWAAHRHSIPVVLAYLSPLFWLSRQEPGHFGSTWVPPRWLHKRSIWIARAMIHRMMMPSMPELCSALGIRPPKRPFDEGQHDATLNLGMWSPTFRGPCSDDPPRSQICGFPWTEAGPVPSLSRELESFLDAGPAPVVVGLGSAVKLLGNRIYSAVANACATLGLRCILVGAPNDCEVEERSDLLRLGFAPYPALFPRAQVVVHPGGIGTTYEAMMAGRPTIIIPFGNDQFDNGVRAARLGSAVLLSRQRATARRVAEALQAVLTETLFEERAVALAARLRTEPSGAKEAVRHIETTIGVDRAPDP